MNEEALRARPSQTIWSALEYAVHVSETVMLFADRTELVLTVDEPALVYQDQDAAVVQRYYNGQDPRTVARELTANTERYAALLEGVSPTNWSRTGTRLPGERFDVGGLARFTIHEARHH